ncbi:MAG: macro domain-containing protein [Bdellovibrionaceae bacterium]|nr:macro domain-containing protein [Bdellovibrionales bacterium]MCB9085638.1 macro domain-containing protein [Pseudobdellovibrionaceae bacterium]
MLKEVTGDILLSKADVIAHGVAPNDDFHQGLALSLRERWPAMYKDFRHFCKVKHPEAGDVWVWQGAEGAAIANLLTQEGAYDHGAKPGKANHKFVDHALKNFHQEIEKNGWKSVAITRLATGVGGMDWNEVQPLLEKHLGATLKIPVYVYTTYQAGEAANEG